MPPQIIIELVGDPPSAPGVPLVFPFSKIAVSPPQVKLKLASIVGVSSVVWSIVDQDENALAVLSDPAALEPTFDPTAAISSTYLVQVLVNGNQLAQSGIAFTTKNLAIRKPAASEKTLFDATDGWKTALNRALDTVDAAHESAAEEDWKRSVRLRVDGDALAAHTRIGNVITADANGLLPDQDGRTPVDGDSIILVFSAPNVDAGVYDINTVGSAGTKFQFTRRTDFDEDSDVTEGIRVPVADGDDFGAKVARLVTVGTITINTTAIDFVFETSGAGVSTVGSDTIAANQDDYSPANWKNLTIIRVDGGVLDRTITGLDSEGGAPTRRDRVVVMNVGTTNNLILAHNDNGANSLLINEMQFPLPVDHVLGPNGDTLEMFFDVAAAFWRPV